MVGILHPGYVPLSLPWWVYYTLGIYHPTIPGYTMVYTVLPVLYILPLMVSGCPLMEPWAQVGNNPWVGREESPSSPKGVMREGGLCAELLALSAWYRIKDWIDEG